MQPGLETRKGERLSLAGCHRLTAGAWGGSGERGGELGMFPDSAAVRSLAEALPLLIGCGNGEASRRQDGGRLISSSSRSEVSGNERQR